MTQRNAPDLDLVLGAFLGEGPSEAPDRAIEGALDAIKTTGQIRRPWTGGPFTMPAQFRLVAVAAAIVVLVALAAVYVGNQKPVPTSVPTVIPTIGPAASPSPTPLPSPSPVAVDPMSTLIRAAISAADRAATATLSARELTAEEEGSLLQLLDDMGVALDEQHARSVDLADTFAAKVDSYATKLQNADGDGLRSTAAALVAIMRSTPFAAPMTAGIHYSEQFLPIVVLDTPDGWGPGQQDREGMIIKKGQVQLVFHLQGAQTVSAASAGDASHPAKPVTFGAFSGFESTTPIEALQAITLYIDSGLRAIDTRDGDATRTWLVDFNGKALTIILVGTPADVTAALPEVRSMLATLQSP